MPSIARIRFTHVVYEGGNKRYNDSVFQFDGHNGAVVLENGGGKTVFIQSAIQAVLPHSDLAGRKIKDTLQLDNGPAHIAIEWILTDKPRRRYVVTCVSLFQSGSGIDSYRYVYEYGEHDNYGLAHIPFAKDYMGKSRPADKGEIHDYYLSMQQRDPLHAKLFGTITEYKAYLEQQYQIITGEWEAIVKINDTEGGIESFFDECKTTKQLFDRLLIPTIERSIEGYEQGKFVKMFETRREGFERYKQLKEQIDENKRILLELGEYIELFARLDREVQHYDEARSEAKAYWQLTVERQHTLDEAHRQLQLQVGEQADKEYQLKRKLKSYELAKESQEQGAIQTKLELIEKELEVSHSRLLQAEHAYYSLQYAESREKCLAVQAEMKQLIEQMKRLSVTEDERALEENWQRNGGQLRFTYLMEEKLINDQRLKLEQRLQQLMKEVEVLEANKARLEQEAQIKHDAILKMETEIDKNQKYQAGIAASLLSNPQLEKVEIQYPLWVEEEQRLEHKRLELMKERKVLEEERAWKEQKRKDIADIISKSSEELVKLVEQDNRYHADLDDIRLKLVALRPAWERFSSLYEKEATIKDNLSESIEKLLLQKQKLLMKERIAYRFVDDHGEQPLFFADAQVSRLCEQWSHHFSLLQLGTDYINGLSGYLQRDAGGESGSLWAITLITTASEKITLQQRLLQSSNDFVFPIRVLSVQEAANEVNGAANAVGIHNCWVVPEHWINNEKTDEFHEWKDKLLNQAETIKSEREQLERTVIKWQNVQSSFYAFLSKYPLQAQQMLEQRRMRIQELVVERKREYEQIEYDLQHNRELVEQCVLAIEEAGNQIIQLQHCLKQGQLYIKLWKETSKLEEGLVPAREQLELFRYKTNQERTLLEQLNEFKQEISNSVQAADLQLSVLRQEEYYREVEDYSPISTALSKLELTAERKRLKDERNHIRQEQSQLEALLNSGKLREQDYMQVMDKLRREHPELAIDMPLPLDVSERLNQTWSRIEGLRSEYVKVQSEHSRVERELVAKEGACDKLQKQFDELFPNCEPIRFTEPLHTIQLKLMEEDRELLDKREQLNAQHQILLKQLAEISQVMDEWNRHLIVYGIEDVKLTHTVIRAEDQTEFIYKPMSFTKQCLERLKMNKANVDKEQASVKGGRMKVKEYCIQHVKDTKLRYMTIQAIDMKEHYAEMLEFQQSMENRIQMAIHIWELELQTQDQELQQYIMHIHSHLKLIVQELKEIPKKTRVKSEDGWKEIYSIACAEWDDQEGKERIRKHIEWIMNKLEGLSKEQDQQVLVRKDLEKWLDTRTLLQHVMQGEGMKVTCRKVSNDQQISRAAYSWEQSNRWSGGEKWSKNMTLFLGLLNYIAERKQFIKTQMKRHRTVILDNPFGKASSDHVLSPVFFIAEQLGFQIIALTAHVEGKFLQDYFPVVYSCRLRSSTDAAKQIVEAVQTIQTAYFKDHDPTTLERIGANVDQLELF